MYCIFDGNFLFFVTDADCSIFWCVPHMSALPLPHNVPFLFPQRDPIYIYINIIFIDLNSMMQPLYILAAIQQYLPGPRLRVLAYQSMMHRSALEKVYYNTPASYGAEDAAAGSSSRPHPRTGKKAIPESSQEVLEITQVSWGIALKSRGCLLCLGMVWPRGGDTLLDERDVDSQVSRVTLD